MAACPLKMEPFKDQHSTRGRLIGPIGIGFKRSLVEGFTSWPQINNFHVQSLLTNKECVTTNGWVEVDGCDEILQSLIWFIGFSKVWSTHDSCSIEDKKELGGQKTS